ncbi:hypothetical protein [Paenisporosarcina indica]|uniref:hypothetical protein n=1 Tax=Paenisporosarcina indica TaxID=650093 RepID=UPI00137332ED|nr:hypothetical protein [Paenisporosarcina indica]
MYGETTIVPMTTTETTETTNLDLIVVPEAILIQDQDLTSISEMTQMLILT